MYEGSETKMKSKRIPYLVKIGYKNIDEESYEEDSEDTDKEMDKYINTIEFHEKVHAYIFGIFGVPCIIVYVFRYSPYFLAHSGFCMPLKPINRFQTILSDILHFLWDLFDVLHNYRSNKLNSRNPQGLLKELIKSITTHRKYHKFEKFDSIDEIKSHIDNYSLEMIKKWDQGIYHFRILKKFPQN